MTNKKLNYPAIAKETAILTGAVAIIAAAVYFSAAQSYIRQQYFRPWHRAF